MMSKPKIAVIVSSTRPTRFADIPTKWIVEKAADHGELDVEVVDLRDYPMPFFDEVASNAWVPSVNEVAKAWQAKLAEFDGYIFVVAEYNRSITGVLKNALDQAYVEWARKPAGIVAYGSVGGTRAAEHLRNIAVELQMVPVRAGVHIGGGDFFKVHPGFGGSGNLADIAGSIDGPAKALLDDVTWWAKATKAARG
ncbi:NADPH-dependent FMN reductase [Fuscibacter oryzae]|uniref:NAD(P)H-dependent oxidoreductase n=1 Tax=Fuscibacter oryzae TaxID=2803939 RepID=A0A8J7MR29_9RHOB|nr:NAD(P)H-dependent oxidoreductase [Fuscibacter oryzae]